MSKEQIISNYLRTGYSDVRLAALYAHVSDGKFSFVSCCCVRGASNADHALRGRMDRLALVGEGHYKRSMYLVGALEAEAALMELIGDAQRDEVACAVMLPLIEAEMKRRETERAAKQVEDDQEFFRQLGIQNKQIAKERVAAYREKKELEEELPIWA